MANWKDFRFFDEETGEDFFVEIDCDATEDPTADAYAIAEENFSDPQLTGIYDPEYAEMLGLDTY